MNFQSKMSRAFGILFFGIMMTSGAARADATKTLFAKCGTAISVYEVMDSEFAIPRYMIESKSAVGLPDINEQILVLYRVVELDVEARSKSVYVQLDLDGQTGYYIPTGTHERLGKCQLVVNFPG